jgi:hypothetical protein
VREHSVPQDKRFALLHKVGGWVGGWASGRVAAHDGWMDGWMAGSATGAPELASLALGLLGLARCPATAGSSRLALAANQPDALPLAPTSPVPCLLLLPVGASSLMAMPPAPACLPLLPALPAPATADPHCSVLWQGRVAATAAARAPARLLRCFPEQPLAHRRVGSSSSSSRGAAGSAMQRCSIPGQLAAVKRDQQWNLPISPSGHNYFPLFPALQTSSLSLLPPQSLCSRCVLQASWPAALHPPAHAVFGLPRCCHLPACSHTWLLSYPACCLPGFPPSGGLQLAALLRCDGEVPDDIQTLALRSLAVQVGLQGLFWDVWASLRAAGCIISLLAVRHGCVMPRFSAFPPV